MKKRFGKQAISALLCLCMLLGLLPMAALATGAQNNGPSSSEYTFIKLAGSNYAETVIYGQDATSVNGISYNSTTNTLTLNNLNAPDKVIAVNMMGDDFKIELLGESSIGGIKMWGDNWGCGLTFTGNGSLTVNQSRAQPYGIALLGEGAEPKLAFGNTATVTVYAGSAFAVFVDGCSLDTTNITYSGITSGCQVVEKQPYMGRYVTYSNSNGNSGWMTIYTKDSQYFGAAAAYSASHTTYTMYPLTGDPTSGFTAGTAINGQKGLPSVPTEYTPVYDSYRNLSINDSAEFGTVDVVTFSPSGGGTVVRELTINTNNLPVAYKNETYRATLSATPAVTGASITWSLEEGSSLPDGLTLNSDGTISGTVSASAATASFTVVATEAGGGTKEKELTITVKERLRITSAASAPFVPGAQLSHELTSNIENTRWSIVGTKPSWLSIEPSTGVVSGTAPYGATDFSITVQASADGQTATQTLQFTVSNAFTFTVSGVDSDMNGFWYSLRAKSAEDEEYDLHLADGQWTGDTAQIPTSLTFAGRTVYDVQLVAYLNGETDSAVLAETTGAVTLTPDTSGTLTGKGNEVLAILPDITCAQSGIGTYVWFEKDGVRYEPGALVKHGDGFTPKANVWSSGDSTVMYNTDRPQFTPATCTAGSTSEVTLFCDALTKKPVTITLTRGSGGAAADLSGLGLTLSQTLANGKRYTVTATVGANNTCTAELYAFTDAEFSAYLSGTNSWKYRLQTSHTVADRVEIKYYDPEDTDMYLRVTPTYNDDTLAQYAHLISSWTTVRAEDYRASVNLGTRSSSRFALWNDADAEKLVNLKKNDGSLTLEWDANDAILAGRSSVHWPKDSMEVSADLSLTLKGGVLMDVNYEGQSFFFMTGWWHQSGTWLRGQAVKVSPGANTAANYCPGTAGTYDFLLLPSDVNPSGMTWDEVKAHLDYQTMPMAEGLTIANNTVIKKSFSLSEIAAKSARYLTAPRSTFVGPSQFKQGDMLLFSGHIELDDGVTDQMTAIWLASDQSVIISSVVVGGTVYPVNDTQFTQEFSSPLSLPCDISVYGVPNRTQYDGIVYLDLKVELDNRYYEPIGRVTVSGAPLELHAPARAGGDSVNVLLTNRDKTQVDIYDNDVLVYTGSGDGYVTVPFAGVRGSFPTLHTLTVCGKGTRNVLASHTVIHQQGVPTLAREFIETSYFSNYFSEIANHASYSFASSDRYRVGCVIENAGYIKGDVTFAVSFLDGTKRFMKGVSQGDDKTTFRTEAFTTSSPVIGAKAIFEIDWEKLPRDEVITIPVDVTLPADPPATDTDLIQEAIAAWNAHMGSLKTQVVTQWNNNAHYAIIDIGPTSGGFVPADSNSFVPAGDVIGNITSQAGNLAEGEAGVFSIVRPAPENYVPGQSGTGIDGDWTTIKLDGDFTGSGTTGGTGGGDTGGEGGMELQHSGFTVGEPGEPGSTSGSVTVMPVYGENGETLGYMESINGITIGTGTNPGDGTSAGGGTGGGAATGGGASWYSTTEFQTDNMLVFGAACDGVGGGASIVGGIESLRLQQSATGALDIGGKVASGVGGVKAAWDGYSNHMTMEEMVKNAQALMDSPCAKKLDQRFLRNFQTKIDHFKKDVTEAQAWNVAVAGGGVINGMLGAGGWTTPWGLMLQGFTTGQGIINAMTMSNLQNQAQLLRDEMNLFIAKYARLNDDPDCFPKPEATYQAAIDPSGIVYEAVLSNPVEGATVTLYTVDDPDYVPEYTNNSSVPSNSPDSANLAAPDIDSIIPGELTITTGADGRYQWFVPQGLWYVTAEKNGYIGGNSNNDKAATVEAGGKNWLPVMPPQLNVNIPLVSKAIPVIQDIRFSTDGVYITFSKYMDDATLIDGNFKINDGAATVTKLNSEAAPDNIEYGGDAPTYTSQIKLTPASGTLSGNVKVEITGDVKSYAGVSIETVTRGGTVESASQTAAAPTIAPAGGRVKFGDTVTVSADNGAQIYYTTDGTDPTQGSARYTGPIAVTRSMTIKAIAVQYGTNSSIASASFTLQADSTTIGGNDPYYDPSTPPAPPSGGGGGGAAPAYDITVPKADNGSVSISPKNAKAGDTVTITVTPDKGYKLDSLTVLDKDGKAIELTKKDGKYTFKMPAGKVTVKVSFKKIAVVNPFVDVKNGDYFYDAVLWAVDKSITVGTSDTTFSPNEPCTRAQIVTFLWRAAGSPEPKSTASFSDVAADAYYAKAVAWAVEQGITKGTSATTFSPDEVCTRAQAVTFLSRALKGKATAGNTFADVAANSYYAEAVAWAVANDITYGTSATTFSPNEPCTRGQIVTFLWRAMAE